MSDGSVSASLVPHDGYLPSPVTLLERLFPEASQRIVAKLDALQLSGSTKERTAYSLLHGLLDRGELVAGGTAVESTSGNLGMALARQCAPLGVRFVAVVDESANAAACSVMRAYGAEVVLVPTPPDGNRLRARREMVATLLAERAGAITTNQYGNPDNPAAHRRSTLPELVRDLGSPPSHLYVAMSTTGTVLGCEQAIREHGWQTELIGVDSVGSVLFCGEPGERKLPGLGAGVVTALSEQASPNRVVRIAEAEMVLGARLLARREGLLAGASTGAIVAAVGHDLPGLPADATVAILMHDGGVPYLPTVYDDAWVAAELEGGERAIDPNQAANPFAGR